MHGKPYSFWREATLHSWPFSILPLLVCREDTGYADGTENVVQPGLCREDSYLFFINDAAALAFPAG